MGDQTGSEYHVLNQHKNYINVGYKKIKEMTHILEVAEL